MWLIYPRHCTLISIKIGQHLLMLCTKVFWCFSVPHSVVHRSYHESLVHLFQVDFASPVGYKEPEKPKRKTEEDDVSHWMCR